MANIVFIGAGSHVFTRNLVRDLLTFPLLRDAELRLVDIHEGRLDYARQVVQKIIDLGNYPATVTATTDRTEALAGADAVIVTILCGNVEIWQHDILIPKAYGVDINVGDTRGPSGIFRALRTIPTMLDICRDMERLCPNAIMLNYTNPMAMLCHAMQRESFIQSTGLCHSVQGTAAMLARWAGVEPEQVDYTCAGINHMAWFIKFTHHGEDLIPKLLERVATDEEVYNTEQVRNEMFLAMKYYVTESSGHNSEYNWWFRKRPDLIEQYCTSGTGWNPGHYAYILDVYREREATWRQEAEDWLKKDEPMSLERGQEYAASIINARMGGELFEFNGNVANTNLVTNLPQGACVEVPVLVSRKGYEPIHVGALPPSVAPITALTAQTEMMAVEASLTGDPTLVYQAIAYDPLTASVLSLAEIKKMVADMFKRNRDYLPQFKSIEL